MYSQACVRAGRNAEGPQWRSSSVAVRDRGDWKRCLREAGGSRRRGLCCSAAVIQWPGRGMERWSPWSAPQNRTSSLVRSPKTTSGLRSSTGTFKSVQHKTTDRQCSGFRCTMGPIVTFSQWNTDGHGPERIVQVKIAGLCSASDDVGFAWPKDSSEQMDNQAVKVEGISETTWWSDEENSKLQSSERQGWERSNTQGSQREKRQTSRGNWRLVTVEAKRTVCQGRLM